MSKTMRQVLLRKTTPNGYSEDVFWIDNDFAKAGRKVKDEKGQIWEIREIYNTKEFANVERQIEVWDAFREVLDGH